jgi:hypothetical protein
MRLSKSFVWLAMSLAAIAGVLIWHSLLYGFVTDDAYISFVYSKNFAEHGQLVFNVGYPPVEGYTNFLWTLLLGLLMKLGIAPESASVVLGTGFAVGTLIVCFRLTASFVERATAWDLLAPGLLALSSGFACWSSGGLETQLFTFLVVSSIYAYRLADREVRYYRRMGALLALAAMTRPEGLLVTALIGVHRLGVNILRDRRVVPNLHELSALGAFLLLWAPWFIWRYLYYGYPFPNTYYVKAAGEATEKYHQVMRKNGLAYVWQWATQSKALYSLPLALVAAALTPSRESGWRRWITPRSPRVIFGSFFLLLAAVYLYYTVSVGGDFMGLHRFVMPVFVLAALGASLGLRALCETFVPDKQRVIAGGVAAALLVGLFGYSQINLTRESTRSGNWKSSLWGIDTPSYLAVYAHDRKLIGQHMKQCFRDDDFSIFGGVGAKPYYSGAKGIDVFGLVSDVVAHEVKRTVTRAGHNKWADDGLLLDTYQPTFVFHRYQLHRGPKSPPIGRAGFWKSKGYEQVTLFIPGLVERGEYYTFFVRKDRAESFKQTCPGVQP